MSRYAMICLNRVIDILDNQEVEPKWPPDMFGNPVTAVTCADECVIGMSYDPETNTFGEVQFTPLYPDLEPEIPTPEPLTESEERQIDILLNTEYIACLLENQLA